MIHIRLPKRLLAVCLAAALAAVPAAAFSDTEGHWAQEAIDKWSQEYSVIYGYGDDTFRPDAAITRGAFAGVLDRFMKYRDASAADTFTDTAGNAWESAILRLNAAGVYYGDRGSARPVDPITRQQAVTMLARAFDISGQTRDLPYSDASQLAEYAQGAVAEMTVRGYITDCFDGRFRPEDAITRAEVLSILNNMISVLIWEPGTYSADVSGTLMINAADGATLSDMTISGDLILAPGVTGPVTLNDVTLNGRTLNLSAVEPVFSYSGAGETVLPDPPPEVQEGILPSEVYVPTETTGEFLEYGERQIPIYADAEASRLGEGDFVWNEDQTRLEYIGDDFDTRFGIDVSAYQNRSSVNEQIDWEAAAADGVEFAMVRIGLRGYGTGKLAEDAFYEQNIRGAMDAGIETGVYFFAQAITVEEAIQEADFVIERLQDLDIDGPVAYDWEMHDASYRVYGTTPEMATACAIAFCERIREAGYTPMVYAGSYVSYVKYDQGALEPYLYWYPEYKNASSETLCPGLYYQMDYWQYTSKCRVDGIGGDVDANIQFLP